MFTHWKKKITASENVSDLTKVVKEIDPEVKDCVERLNAKGFGNEAMAIINNLMISINELFVRLHNDQYLIYTDVDNIVDIFDLYDHMNPTFFTYNNLCNRIFQCLTQDYNIDISVADTYRIVFDIIFNDDDSARGAGDSENGSGSSAKGPDDDWFRRFILRIKSKLSSRFSSLRNTLKAILKGKPFNPMDSVMNIVSKYIEFHLTLIKGHTKLISATIKVFIKYSRTLTNFERVGSFLLGAVTVSAEQTLFENVITLPTQTLRALFHQSFEYQDYTVLGFHVPGVDGIFIFDCHLPNELCDSFVMEDSKTSRTLQSIFIKTKRLIFVKKGVSLYVNKNGSKLPVRVYQNGALPLSVLFKNMNNTVDSVAYFVK